LRSPGHFEPYPSGAPLFDRQYAAGDWDRLGDVAEAPRYGVIAAYCRHFAPKGRLLDVSAEAVAAARATAGGRGAFHVADAAEYRPEGCFDAVIFNEVLYYVDAPGEVVARYGRSLAPGGVMIVSQWDGMGRSKGAQLWRLVMRGHEQLAQTRIVTDGDRSSTIRVLRPSKPRPDGEERRAAGPVAGRLTLRRTGWKARRSSVPPAELSQDRSEHDLPPNGSSVQGAS
jgi:SAM-dependent methyltransferase